MSVLVGVGTQVNKFEQVSNDGHQMSLAGVDMSRVGGYVPRGVGVCMGYPSKGSVKGWGPLQCDLSHNACDVTYLLPVDRQMPVKTLPSRNYCYRW